MIHTMSPVHFVRCLQWVHDADESLCTALVCEYIRRQWVNAISPMHRLVSLHVTSSGGCGYRGRHAAPSCTISKYIHRAGQEGVIGNFCSAVWGDTIQAQCISHRSYVEVRYIVQLCTRDDNKVHCTSFLRYTSVIVALNIETPRNEYQKGIATDVHHGSYEQRRSLCVDWWSHH